jgi:hypothetical protein
MGAGIGKRLLSAYKILSRVKRGGGASYLAEKCKNLNRV